MSEKRFVVNKKGIFDNQTKKAYLFVAYDWIECEIYEVVELLNEQQAKINELEEIILDLTNNAPVVVVKKK